jgi:hypothetical protein
LTYRLAYQADRTLAFVHADGPTPTDDRPAIVLSAAANLDAAMDAVAQSFGAPLDHGAWAPLNESGCQPRTGDVATASLLFTFMRAHADNVWAVRAWVPEWARIAGDLPRSRS